MRIPPEEDSAISRCLQRVICSAGGGLRGEGKASILDRHVLFGRRLEAACALEEKKKKERKPNFSLELRQCQIAHLAMWSKLSC